MNPSARPRTSCCTASIQDAGFLIKLLGESPGFLIELPDYLASFLVVVPELVTHCIQICFQISVHTAPLWLCFVFLHSDG